MPAPAAFVDDGCCANRNDSPFVDRDGTVEDLVVAGVHG
jgi:hypothetical protein